MTSSWTSTSTCRPSRNGPGGGPLPDAAEYDCGDPDGELTLIFTSVVANLDDGNLDGVVLN
ncbi:MAG: hypothetical protein AB7L91_04405 [Dehalococcoidia bacterium]